MKVRSGTTQACPISLARSMNNDANDIEKIRAFISKLPKLSREICQICMTFPRVVSLTVAEMVK